MLTQGLRANCEKGTSRWDRHLEQLKIFYSNLKTPQHYLDDFPSQTDIPSGCTHYVIFDSFGNASDHKGKVDWRRLNNQNTFRSRWIDKLTTRLPSFGISTMRGGSQWDLYYLKKNIPVLMLNARVRLHGKGLKSFDDCEIDFWNFQKKLIEMGTNDSYNRSFLALWHQLLSNVEKREAKEAKQHGNAASDNNNDVKDNDNSFEYNSKELIYMKIRKDIELKKDKKLKRRERDRVQDEDAKDATERLHMKRINKILHLRECCDYVHMQVKQIWLYWHLEDLEDEIKNGYSEQYKGIQDVEALTKFCQRRSIDWSLCFGSEAPYKKLLDDIYSKHCYKEEETTETNIKNSQFFVEKDVVYKGKVVATGFDLAD